MVLQCSLNFQSALLKQDRKVKVRSAQLPRQLPSEVPTGMSQRASGGSCVNISDKASLAVVMGPRVWTVQLDVEVAV